MVQPSADPAVNQQSPHIKSEAAEDYSAQTGAFAMRCETLTKRENDWNTNDEDEEGEDEVIASDAGPGLMIHLSIQHSKKPIRPRLVNPMNQLLSTDNPEHVEAS